MRFFLSVLLAALLCLTSPAETTFCVRNLVDAGRPAVRMNRRGFYTPRQLFTIYARHRITPGPSNRLPSSLDFEHGELPIEIYDFDDPAYAARLREVNGTCLPDTFGNCETFLGEGHKHFSIIGIRTSDRTERQIALTIAEELSHARFAQDFMFRMIHSERLLLFQDDVARKTFDEFYAKYEAARAIRGAARPNSNILAQLAQGQGGDRQDFAYLFWAARVTFGKSLDDLTLDEICRTASRVVANPVQSTPTQGRLLFLGYYFEDWIQLASARWYRFADEAP